MRWRVAAWLCATAFGAADASGQTTQGQSSSTSSAPLPSTPAAAQPATPPSAPAGVTGLFAQPTLGGDLLGLRPRLASEGISIGLEQTSEVIGNPTGGVRTGADYEGLTLASMGLDTGPLLGWSGGTFNVSALWIQGRDLATDDLLSLQIPSGIEAQRAVRLWEAWFDQRFAGGRVDVKLGQQSLDQEFINGVNAALFLNALMGWPGVPSYDLYAGGPAYPLSTLGVRLRGVTGHLTAQIGFFDDNPSGGSFFGDSALRGAERTGTLLNIGGGALTIAELSYTINQPDLDHPDAKLSGLPGTYRLGGWFDSGAFPDRRYNAAGFPLAVLNSSQTARLLRNDFSLYASGDQEVWSDRARKRSLSVFLRVMGAPDDRNLLSFSANGGMTLRAPLTARPNDTAGLGAGLVKVSRSVSEADAAQRIFSRDPAYPIRSSESFVELTYQVQVAPWWQVQPDFQYVWTPSGGIFRPGSSQRVGNEAVFGLRTNVSF